jgi:hypothetical protein
MTKISVWTGLLAALLTSSAFATTCPDGGNLSAFLGAGYSCQIGDKVFSNFTYTDSAVGGAVAVPATGVTVDTLGPTTGSNPASIANANIGLQFNAGWDANAGQVTDSDIGFTVTVVGGGSMLIEDLGLAQVAGVAPNGSASVAEAGCGPAPCTPGVLSVLTFNNGSSNTATAETLISTPVGSVTVSKDISASGGTTGFANLSLVSDTFSQTSVPEPASLILFGSVLAGVCGIVRRRRTQKA